MHRGLLTWWVGGRGPMLRILATTVLSVLLAIASGCRRPTDNLVGAIVAAYDDDARYTGLKIAYPLDGTLFPPDVAPPTFRWTDPASGSDSWLIAFRFAPQERPLCFLVSETEWTPNPLAWKRIKENSSGRPSQLAVLGVKRTAPHRILSGARIAIETSPDEVGAPLFYREVNLPFIEAVKDPTKIHWRMGPVSSQEPPPIVLTDLPVCGNCHSFSADGTTLGMDVDYANDKGSYALAGMGDRIALTAGDLITWSDFRRDDGRATFGLLSQVSPDGRYVISTVKDRSVFVAKPDLAFSQLFFPIQGILAVYDRRTGEFRALPGADDPQYVQSNPTWSPDGRTIVFARSRAHRLPNDTGRVLLTKEECAEFLEDGREFLFDLYRIPFNGGAGGLAEPLPGASQNGRSNFFARYSPDGRRIVFCQARSYMLLQPDSELYIMPAAGGEPRRLRCNTGRMNSWHSWSPNGKWLVFSSKAFSDYTQLCLTHIDEQGRSTPPVLLSRLTASDRAANIPEFVNTAPTTLARIEPRFIDDVSWVRAGDAFLRAGHDVEGAIQRYRRALELNPLNAVAHSNLGGLLVTRGETSPGVSHLEEAIRLDPNEGSPHYNLGMHYSRQGLVNEAIEHLGLAVRHQPDLTDAHGTLGALLCSRGEFDRGTVHLMEAARLEPGSAVLRYNHGRALAAQGRVEEAVSQLAAAVMLDANHIAARILLAELLFDHGQSETAVRQLTEAIEIDPRNVGVLELLAWMLATAPDPKVRNGDRATEFATRACTLTGNSSFQLLDVLGIAQAAAGRFPEAIQSAERARDLARAAGRDEPAADIAARIELYRKGKPFVPPASSRQ